MKKKYTVTQMHTGNGDNIAGDISYTRIEVSHYSGSVNKRKKQLNHLELEEEQILNCQVSFSVKSLIVSLPGDIKENLEILKVAEKLIQLIREKTNFINEKSSHSDLLEAAKQIVLILDNRKSPMLEYILEILSPKLLNKIMATEFESQKIRKVWELTLIALT